MLSVEWLVDVKLLCCAMSVSTMAPCFVLYQKCFLNPLTFLGLKLTCKILLFIYHFHHLPFLLLLTFGWSLKISTSF